MLHTPHNVKFKIMNYNRDLDKIFREAGTTCSRNYTRSSTPCRRILTTNSDVTGTQKLNHLFLRELFPNTRTQYKHMKDLSWVSLQRIPEQSFLEVTRPF